MKKCVYTILGVLLGAGMLSGCGTPALEAESSVVYVDKKGAVLSVDVEELGADYYDETELSDFVNAAVEEYTEEHGKSSVKVESLSVEDDTAKLQMKYKTTQDYWDFNGIELYQGKVVAALAAGYVFDGDFAKVENGKVVGAATKQDIYAEKDLKTVIIRANTDVKIDGEICYVSCENVKLTGADGVSIREGYYLDNGRPSESIIYQEETGTEQMTGTEEASDTETASWDAGTVGTVRDDGSFETDVYTFIVYK